MTGAEKQRIGAAARLAAIVAALCFETFAFTGACSSGVTPICGPDAGCGPGPCSDAGTVTGDGAVE